MNTVKENTYRPAFMAEAVWPQSSLLRDLALILAGSWLIALTAQIEIPMWPVPMTGQTFAMLLIGALLGKKRGVASVVAYLTQGAMGLPFFAGGKAGVLYLFGYTGGFLFGFIVVVYVVGWLSELGWGRRLTTAVLAMLVGNVLLYAFGLTWLATLVGWGAAVKAGFLPFIVGDLVKIGLAALALPTGWALMKK